MLKTVRKAFQIEDIRKRIFYTFVMLVIVRLGSQLPTPGVEDVYKRQVMNPNDHPHGGGEGKTGIGRPGPCTPWGKPCLLYTSRCV